jgi:hypothetical protein
MFVSIAMNIVRDEATVLRGPVQDAGLFKRAPDVRQP